MADCSDYSVDVARIGGAHGVRGQVKVQCYSDLADRMATLQQVCIRPKNGPAFLTRVVEARQVPHRNVYIVSLVGVDDRDQAVSLAGADISILAGQSPPLPEDTYYVSDIVGLQVVTDQGQQLGTVVEIIHTGANDVYQLDSGVLVPAIAQVIAEVDLSGGRMVITPLAGMLE